MLCFSFSLWSTSFLLLQICPWAEGATFLPPLGCCQTVYLYCLMCFFLSLWSILTSAAVLIRAALTDWPPPPSVSLSPFLWTSVCALSLSSPSYLSFRHYQTKAYFKTFWKRYISLISSYSSPLCHLSSLPVFIFFPSALANRFALCVIHFIW